MVKIQDIFSTNDLVETINLISKVPYSAIVGKETISDLDDETKENVEKIRKKFQDIDNKFCDLYHKPRTEIHINTAREMEKIEGATVTTCACFASRKNIIHLNLSEIRNPFCFLRNLIHEERHKFQYFSDNDIFRTAFRTSENLYYKSDPRETDAYNFEKEFVNFCYKNIKNKECSFTEKEKEQIKEMREQTKDIFKGYLSFVPLSVINRFQILSHINQDKITDKNSFKNFFYKISPFFNLKLNLQYTKIQLPYHKQFAKTFLKNTLILPAVVVFGISGSLAEMIKEMKEIHRDKNHFRKIHREEIKRDKYIKQHQEEFLQQKIENKKIEQEVKEYKTIVDKAIGAPQVMPCYSFPPVGHFVEKLSKEGMKERLQDIRRLPPNSLLIYMNERNKDFYVYAKTEEAEKYYRDNFPYELTDKDKEIMSKAYNTEDIENYLGKMKFPDFSLLDKREEEVSVVREEKEVEEER